MDFWTDIRCFGESFQNCVSETAQQHAPVPRAVSLTVIKAFGITSSAPLNWVWSHSQLVCRARTD